MKLFSALKKRFYMVNNIQGINVILLAVIFLFALILRLGFFSGIVSGDDMIYAYEIYKYSTGDLTPGVTHWSLRLGFILPVVFFVRIFGFNEFALTLFPLICSMANILLIYSLAKLLFNNEKIALYAAFLLSFFPLEVFFATMVFVDIPVSLFMGGVVFYFLKGDIQHKAYNYLLSGFCLGMAYLSRLTGLYIVLFFIFYIIVKRRFKRQYLLVALVFLSVIFLEWGYYYLVTGDPLYRFRVITGSYRKTVGQPEPEQSDDSQTSTEGPLFKGKDIEHVEILRGNNWFIEPLFTLTTNQEFGFFYYFLVPVALYYLIKRDKNTAILLMWMIPLFIYILYGTTKPLRFSPLRRWPRYLAPVTLPAVLIFAHFLNEKKNWLWKKFSFLTISFLLATSFLCIWLFNDGPTDSYIVKEIARFREQYRQKNVLVYWEMYQHLAPFLEYQKTLNNVKLYGFPEENKPIPEHSVYYGVGLTDPDKAEDSYIAVPLYDYELEALPQQHPTWEQIHLIVRPNRFYCPLFERFTFIPDGIKVNLCSTEVCTIYYIP